MCRVRENQRHDDFFACRRHPAFLTSHVSCGAIAQLGERYNGIVEVTGSIPVGSTNKFKGLDITG